MSYSNQDMAIINNYGAIEEMNFDDLLSYANKLVAYDDVLMALNILKMLPAYYLDHKPPEITELEKAINKKIATPHFYAKNVETGILTYEEALATFRQVPRFNLLLADVQSKAIDLGKSFHISEVAPGPYAIPMYFANSYRFTYDAQSLNPALEDRVRAILQEKWPYQVPSDAVKFFVAFEFIEHLTREQDIATHYENMCPDADFIHITTPYGSYDGRKEAINWREKDLGHLRTYNERQFCDVVCGMFSGYTWTLHRGPVMHLRGEKIK